jgi:predicted DNA-binding protein YlxM (UPF0122 family)
MDRELMLVIVSGALTGFFALAGIGLMYFLSGRTARENRRRDYVRDALQPARKYANIMEMDVKNIIWLLAGLNMGLPHADKKLLKQSINNVRRYFIDNTWLPEIADKSMVGAWQRVSDDFAQLHLVFGQYLPELTAKKSFKAMTPSEIKEIRDMLSSDNPDKIRTWIAPDTATQEIYKSLMSLLTSVQAFRQQIERLSTS